MNTDVPDSSNKAESYRRVRSFSEKLCETLVPEDYVIQTMPDVSPTKWHLAHMSWFFETFILKEFRPDYETYHPDFAYLFNSYYVAAGERHCRPKRGLVSRPTVEDTFKYRAYVDKHMIELLESADTEMRAGIAPLLEIGLNHEQQHQELIQMDIKHVLTENPLRPVYRDRKDPGVSGTALLTWKAFDEGVYWFGHDGDGFSFDNEGPQHRQFIESFELASRLVTCGEFLEFMHDGGYERPDLWLSEGWAKVENEGWESPFYWENHDGQWMLMTLAGMRPVEENEPVCHVNYFEADAFARWAGARLPTEFEWELAARDVEIKGNFVEDGYHHPVPAPHDSGGELTQMFGDVWEWTRSSYAPYPGYYPIEGALGEYNGKFMSNQYVLRGGSCATPGDHIRPTYRNFFPSDACWQFSGIRLAREV
ncbi:MAG: ergothioneine biosynthesis protein EgtB [Sphaerobacteraceae bacterium]|nr:MAG: ergothioneine biosynthesis protein EgtB [Sphaerobacteraceae bacterium]